MNFSEAMSWVEEKHRFPEDLTHFHSLRFQELAERSHLFANLPRLVVVTGSCGKASTARFLAFMLRAAGLRVGLGTKPPLQESPHGNLERYQLIDSDGEHWLEPELFAQICSPLPALTQDLSPELGEVAPYDLRTWILLRAFQEWKVDVGIVEANIGLRNDPAGAILGVELTIVTPIATDHAQMLTAPSQWSHLGSAAGPLWHKLSAVPSQKVVVGRQSSISAENLDALLQRSGPRWGRDFTVTDGSTGLWGSRGTLSTSVGNLLLELSCLGDFQLENAATAAMAFFQLGYKDTSAVQAGAAGCQIPGRLQVLAHQPLQLLCVASSKTKVQAMLDSLEPLFDTEEAKMVMVLTLLDRIHGVEDVIGYIATHPRLKTLIVTEGSYHDDSCDIVPGRLADMARRANSHLELLVEPEPEKALALGAKAVNPGDVLLLLGNGIAASVAGG